MQVLIYDSALGKYVPTTASGAQGSTGPQGAQGASGTTGAQGPQGAQGTNLSRVNLANQSSAPATPSSSSNLVAVTTAGRGLFQEQNESGAPYFINAASWDVPYQLITPNSGATACAISGYLPTIVSSGTFSATSTNSFGIFQNIATATSIGAQAYAAGQKMFYRTQATTTYYGGFFFYSKFYFPDASYSNVQVCTGMSSNYTGTLTNGNGPLATESLAVFQYAPDFPWSNTNWQFSYGGTSGSTVVDTTLPFVAQHVYECFIWSANAATTLYWQITDLTTATTKTGTVSVSSSLPSSGVAMQAGLGLQTLNTTAKNIYVERVHVVTDLG